MNVRPNQTLVTAVVRSVRPNADGLGEDVELEVRSNDTQQPDDDFLRPQPGNRLTAFSAAPLAIPAGTVVAAELTLSGGPFGQRTVLREARTIAKS